MVTVKQMALAGSAKNYASYMKFGKFSFTREHDTRGVLSLSITLLNAKFSYAVEASTTEEMDVVQKFCNELVKAFG